jgi:signal recognition particle subunit SEC65
LLNATIKASHDTLSPAKRYIARMSRAFELTHSDDITLRKQLKEAEGLLSTRKIRKTGKRVALKGKFVFSTQEVHKLVEEAEAETARKQSRKQPRKRKPSGKVVIEDNEVSEELSSASDSDFIVVAMRQ